MLTYIKTPCVHTNLTVLKEDSCHVHTFSRVSFLLAGEEESELISPLLCGCKKVTSG